MSQVFDQLPHPSGAFVWLTHVEQRLSSRATPITSWGCLLLGLLPSGLVLSGTLLVLSGELLVWGLVLAGGPHLTELLANLGRKVALLGKKVALEKGGRHLAESDARVLLEDLAIERQ